MTQQDPLYDKWIASVGKRKPILPGTRIEPFVPAQHSGGNVAAVLAMGIGSTAFFAGLGVVSWLYVNETPTNILLAAFFGLAAAGILGYTIYDGLRQHRYGPTTLRLHGPPVVGRELNAELVLPKAPQDLKEIRVELVCESSKWSLRRGNKNRIVMSSDTEVPFAEERKFPVVRFGEGVRCLFRFPIPAGLPPSDSVEVLADPDRNIELGVPYHFWTLKAHADVAGADLKVSFSLAVQPR